MKVRMELLRCWTYAVRQTPSWGGYPYGIRLGLLRSQPCDDIDTGDLVTFWRLRSLTNEQSTHGDVHEFIFGLDEKVMMRGIVGVEVGFGRIDRDLANKPKSVNWCSVLYTVTGTWREWLPRKAFPPSRPHVDLTPVVSERRRL
jgi:hypothetical protein